MTKRKAVTAQMKLDALLFRLATFEGFSVQEKRVYVVNLDTYRDEIAGIYLKCNICGRPIAFGAPIQWDHIHAISMGGLHNFRNLRPTHAVCNHAKGIKEHKAAAKVKRLQSPRKSKRPMKSSGRKIPSRPMRKRA